MKFNIVDINVFYSTFDNVFFKFLSRCFTFFTSFKNIFERFYIYGSKDSRG